jgi:23S rRNA (uridine2552-2'-O)-methyltransferase
MADYKKPDYWQLKARKEGYPARSVYKLQEMDEKFGLLKPSHSAGPFRVLDLGAAPGSWSLYILRKWKPLTTTNHQPPTLVAADISPLSRQYDQGLFNNKNFHFIQGDITHPDVKDLIFSHGPYNLIISDAAPATTGSRFLDTSHSLELAETVLLYAGSNLTENGNLVVKVFQGADSADLLKRMKTLFKTAKSYKPQSCRRESFEAYYLGTGKNAPKTGS